MSRLRIYSDNSPGEPEADTGNGREIARLLELVGVRFERWDAGADLAGDATQDDIIAVYKSDIERLKDEGGYKSVDVIRLAPDNPNKAELRKKFLDEHTHAEDEVRFFVEGSGLFSLHIGDKVYATLCERGDLISVPAGTPHWFDMGEKPHFCAIRLFTNPDGWVANFTGDKIAASFPTYEQYCETV